MEDIFEVVMLVVSIYNSRCGKLAPPSAIKAVKYSVVASSDTVTKQLSFFKKQLT
jgi:hypothetical protein